MGSASSTLHERRIDSNDEEDEDKMVIVETSNLGRTIRQLMTTSSSGVSVENLSSKFADSPTGQESHRQETGEYSTDSSIKSESEEEVVISGSTPHETTEQYRRNVVSGNNDDQVLTSNQPGTTRSGRRVRLTELYGNPVSTSVKGIINFAAGEAEKSTVTPEERRMNKDLVTRARLKEIEGWKEYNVFREIPTDDIPESAKIIKTRFVETWKYSLSGSRSIKARLVIMGIISSLAPTVS